MAISATAPPRLTDRAALARNRARARDSFLHDLAREEAQDRLAMVNRPFRDIAVVSPRPDIWQDSFPDARYVADTDTLALAPGAQDLVIHAMALHWADDPVGQIIQCTRAMRPDGLLLVITPGGETLREARTALTQAETDITGGLSPRILPMGDVRDLGGLLARAGLAMPVADATKLTLAHRDLWHLMRDLRAWGEGNALAGRLRRPTRRAVFDRANDLFCRDFPGSEGRTNSTFEIITLTGWAPGPDQPRPLRPGSGAHRLADALGTTETKLPD
ncbi:MAG: class I SAM-dependent methyltransferase [Marinibacterium sp.]